MGRGGVGWWIIGLLVLWLACTGCQQREETPTKQDLTYMAGGKDLSATAWEPELPADIVLVIDQSGSMSKGKDPTDPMGLRVKGSLAFLEFVAGRSRTALPNRFGVVSFGTETPLKHTVPLTSITSVEDPAVKRIGAQLIPLDLGDTSFISAFRQAIQLLRAGDSFKERRNRAIVIFTDGEPDDPRKLTLQQYFGELKDFIEREVTPQQVHLFIVGIDAAGRRWSATAPLWRQLVGHEQVFTTPSMEALKEHFNRIVQRIWHLPEVRPVVVASHSCSG